MSIRLGNSCVNCKKFENDFCIKHDTSVSDRHTCDSFTMKNRFLDKENCTTCSRYMSPTCAHPKKAAPDMLCSYWAPQVTA
ncbi:hypothetical protein ACFQ3R_04500 [Mesonia ostreae]|uniref:Uncharacterized protein n=2 Tax=Mesonia TaxID=232115 RepID=A0A2W7I2U7_9FLAO|nr:MULTISPECIES: hypothetical protein [Mesonia]MDT0295076.1 hypothetical protein [Mesonia ostreae]PZW39772.1 hypothetical protein LX95_02137 [Mesonia algae]